MVDCFDRIAVLMTELALEPVRQLRERAMLGAVSLRTPSHGRRFLVTITKRYQHGEHGVPRYSWLVEEIEPGGAPLAGGRRCECADDAFLDDPEAAYWAAVDGLCQISQGARA